MTNVRIPTTAKRRPVERFERHEYRQRGVHDPLLIDEETTPRRQNGTVQAKAFAQATQAFLIHLLNRGIRVGRYVWILEGWISNKSVSDRPSSNPNRSVGRMAWLFHLGSAGDIGSQVLSPAIVVM